MVTRPNDSRAALPDSDGSRASSGSPDLPIALIVAGADGGHRALSDGMSGLNRSSITVSRPLEVVRCLLNDAEQIGSVFSPAGDPAFDTRDLFAFMRDDFPHVRRIAYGTHGASRACAGMHDSVWTDPVSVVELSEAVLPEHGALIDAHLLRAWREGDRAAFDLLDRRHRESIRHEVASLQFEGDDADDVVQETLLGLLLTREAIAEGSSLRQLVSDLCTKSALAQQRSGRRRTRLRAACARQARTDRAERQDSERPDKRLLLTDLASRVDAAVDDLPGWCREPFRLCAIEGLAAKRAGAILDMAPAAVSMRLELARGRIAGHLHRTIA